MRQDYSPFSIALIDVFASALGVFMIFSAISMPFILNTSRSSINEPPSSTQESNTQGYTKDTKFSDETLIKELVSAIKEQKSEIADLKNRISKTQSLYDQSFSMELPILFDGNQWYLRPEAKPALDMMGRELSITDVDVTIVGHTAGPIELNRRFCSNFDEFGDVGTEARVKSIAPIGPAFKQCFSDAEWGRYLSGKRAETIKAYLLENYDIDAKRISAYGVGSDDHIPEIAPSDSRNRRVTVTYSNNKKEKG